MNDRQDRLAEIKARRWPYTWPDETLAAKTRGEALSVFERWAPQDVDWLIGEVERLRAALAQADNTISAVRRGAQQARNEIHVALGWDHGGVALVEDPGQHEAPRP